MADGVELQQTAAVLLCSARPEGYTGFPESFSSPLTPAVWGTGCLIVMLVLTDDLLTLYIHNTSAGTGLAILQCLHGHPKENTKHFAHKHTSAHDAPLVANYTATNTREITDCSF